MAAGCAPCRVELCSIPLAPLSEISSAIAAKLDCSILSVRSFVVGSPWNPFCHFQHLVKATNMPLAVTKYVVVFMRFLSRRS